MAILTDAFSTVLRLSLQVLPVLAVVLVVRAVLLRRSSRRVAFALWAVVGFRLLCPAALPSPLSLFNVPTVQTVQTTAQAIQASAQAAIPQAAAGAAGTAPTVTAPLEAVGQAAASVAEGGQSAGVLPSASHTLSLMEWGALLWAAGVAVLLLWGLVSYLCLRRRVAQAVILEGNVYECDAISTPFVLGLVHPRIYLPFRLSPEERTFVLLHERAHLRRHDHWTKPLAFVVLAIYWFHPGVWLSWLLLGRDMEMSCDEAVLRALGSQVKTKYSLSLLGFAAARRFPAPSPLAFGEHDASARIKHVLSWKKAAPAVTFLAVSLCILTVALCGTDAWPGGDTLQKQGTEQAFSYEMYTWRCTLPQDAQTAQLYAETWLDGELFSSQAADEPLSDQSQFRLGGRLDPLGMPQWTLVDTSDGQDTSVCQDATWALPEGTTLTNAAWTVPAPGSFHSGDALLTLDAQTETGTPVSLRIVLRYDGSNAADLARSAPEEELGISLTQLRCRLKSDTAAAELWEEVYLQGQLVSQRQVLPEAFLQDGSFSRSSDFSLGVTFCQGAPCWLYRSGDTYEALPADLGGATIRQAVLGLTADTASLQRLSDNSVVASFFLDTTGGPLSDLPSYDPGWDEARLQEALDSCDGAVLLRLRLYPEAGTVHYAGTDTSQGETLHLYRSQGGSGNQTLTFYAEVYDGTALWSRQVIAQEQPLNSSFSWGSQVSLDQNAFAFLLGSADGGCTSIPVALPEKDYRAAMGYLPPDTSAAIPLPQGKEQILGAVVLSSSGNGVIANTSLSQLQNDLPAVLAQWEAQQVSDVLILLKASVTGGEETESATGLLSWEPAAQGAPYPAHFGALSQYAYTLPADTASVTLYEMVYEHGALIGEGIRGCLTVGQETGQLPGSGSLQLSGHQLTTQAGCEGNGWSLFLTGDDTPLAGWENAFSSPGLSATVFAFRSGQITLAQESPCLVAVGVFPDTAESSDYLSLLSRQESSAVYDLPVDGPGFAAACTQDRVSLLYLIPSAGTEPVQPVSTYARSLYDDQPLYLGDAPAVGQLLEILGVGQTLGGYTMELTTSEHPYALQLNFQAEPQDGGSTLDQGMYRYGALLLALVDNLEEVRWTWPEDGGKVLHTSYLDETDFASLLSNAARPNGQGTGYSSIKELGASPQTLQILVDYLHFPA